MAGRTLPCKTNRQEKNRQEVKTRQV
jgi:hypothetical protein